MAVTINTRSGPVVMFEMWDGFEKGIDLNGGPWVEQTYVLNYADWPKTNDLCDALMGSTTASGGVGGAIIRVPGFPCPTAPNLTCVDARVIGFGERQLNDGGPVQFNLPKVRVRYGIRSWDQATKDDPDGLNSFENSASPGTPYTYATMSIDFGEETIKLPGSAYQFLAPTLATSEPNTRRVGVATLQFERHRVPYLPYKIILPLIAKLNTDVFFGAPKGQVMFVGARTIKAWESDGGIVQDVSLTFKWREFDWNKFPRPDTGVFDFLKNNAGNTVYQYADLTPLLLS